MKENPFIKIIPELFVRQPEIQQKIFREFEKAGIKIEAEKNNN
jgi:hypothetical protein